jgi:molecular chaperone Hsp33
MELTSASRTALHSDHVRRFIFENRPVRGQWVRLEAAWRDLRAHSSYPPRVTELLGEAVAAAVLLAATLKFRGTLALQLQGNGAVNLLVAQCTHDFRLRAVARYDEQAVGAASLQAGEGLFQRLTGSDGRVTVTVEADEKSMRYQGVVPIAGDSLAQSLEAYFANSEQLPTRVVLAANDSHCAGLLVQKLPGAEAQDDEEPVPAWEEAQRAVERVSTPQLLTHGIEELLAADFRDHDLRLFRGVPVSFECRCSPQRVGSVLRALGSGEIRDLLKEQGCVMVTCEFCQRPYRFDSIDVEALFSEVPAPGDTPPLQ